MSREPMDLTDAALVSALLDVGAHLDVGDRPAASLREAILDAVERGPTDAGPSRARRAVRGRHRKLLVAAAVVVAVVVLALSLTPTREAIARWFGIGAVRITSLDSLPEQPSTSAPPAGESSSSAADLEAASKELPFGILLPDPELAGPLRAVRVDASVPSGLVELRYDGFTLVELASRPGGAPVLEKFLDPGTGVQPMRVGDHEGLWISGAPHQVAFLDPDGQMRHDAVRQAGDVLLWVDGSVTYRIEGAPSLDDALALANSMR